MAKKKYYQRPDGLYETSRTINGKRVMFRGKTCREVDEKMLQYKDEAAKGRKFAAIADEWLEQHEREVSHNTNKIYDAMSKELKEVFRGFASDIKPLDVKRYVAGLERAGYARRTVHVKLSTLSQIMSYAVVAGDIQANPAREVRMAKGLAQKERLPLTQEQEAAVCAYRGNDWLLGYMLLFTGCRRGELLALTWQDIDQKAGVIHINKKLNYGYGNTPRVDHVLKTKNSLRDIPLLEQLARVLPKRRIGLIFPGEDGQPLKNAAYQKRWLKYCDAVGLDGVTAHCFRHSFATICFEAGVDSKSAAAFLGDTEETTQSVYQQLRDQQKAAGVALLNEHVKARKLM